MKEGLTADDGDPNKTTYRVEASEVMENAKPKCNTSGSPEALTCQSKIANEITTPKSSKIGECKTTNNGGPNQIKGCGDSHEVVKKSRLKNNSPATVMRKSEAARASPKASKVIKEGGSGQDDPVPSILLVLITNLGLDSRIEWSPNYTRPTLEERARATLAERTCKVCNFECQSKSALKIHMVVHSGKKNFECHFCGNRYTQKSALNLHLRMTCQTKLAIQRILEYRRTNALGNSQEEKTNSSNEGENKKNWWRKQ